MFLAARPLLNNIPSDFVLGSILGYNFTILTLWSTLFLFFCLVRLLQPPRTDTIAFVLVGALLLHVAIFGLTRIFTPAAVVTDFLYLLQFFVAVLVAPQVVDDVEFGRLLRLLFFSSIALILIHISAPFWAHKPVFDSQTGGYIGLFETKHLEAMTFFSLIPYVFLYYLRYRGKLSLAVLLLLVAFLFLSFQRTSLLTFFFMILSILYFSRSLRVAVPALAALLLALILLPWEHYLKFMNEKMVFEYQAYLSGQTEVVGAGRLGVVFFAADWYLNKFSLLQQLVGIGTAQSYRLYLTLWGYFTYAHIQLVHIFVDYGFVGFLFLFLIFFHIYRYRMAQLRQKSNWMNIVAMSVFLSLVVEMFYGMPLTSGGTATLNAFWFLTRGTVLQPEVAFDHSSPEGGSAPIQPIHGN